MLLNWILKNCKFAQIQTNWDPAFLKDWQSFEYGHQSDPYSNLLPHQVEYDPETGVLLLGDIVVNLLPEQNAALVKQLDAHLRNEHLYYNLEGNTLDELMKMIMKSKGETGELEKDWWYSHTRNGVEVRKYDWPRPGEKPENFLGKKTRTILKLSPEELMAYLPSLPESPYLPKPETPKTKPVQDQEQ